METEGLKLKIIADVNDAVTGLNQTSQSIAALKVQQRVLSGEMTLTTAALKANSVELQKNVAICETATKNGLVYGQQFKTLSGQIQIQQAEEKKLTAALMEKTAALENTKMELKSYQAELNATTAGSEKLSRAMNNLTDANSLAAGGVMRLRRMLVGSVFTAAAIGITQELIPAITKLIDSMKSGAKESQAFFNALDGSKDEAVSGRIGIEKIRQASVEFTNGVITQKNYVDLFNKTLGDTVGFISKASEAEDFLKTKAEAYVQFTQEKVAANYALKKSQEAAQEADNIRSKPIQNYSTVGNALKSKIGSPGNVIGGLAPSINVMTSGDIQAQLSEEQRNLATARKLREEDLTKNIKIHDDQYNAYLNHQEKMRDLEKKYKFDPTGSKEAPDAPDKVDPDKLRREHFHIALADLENLNKSQLALEINNETLTNLRKFEIDTQYLEAKEALYIKYGQRDGEIELELAKTIAEEKKRIQTSMGDKDFLTMLNGLKLVADVKNQPIVPPKISQHLKDLDLMNLNEQINNEKLKDKASIVTGLLDPAFQQFFTDITNGTKNIGDAFSGMFISLIKELTATVLKAAALAGIMSLFTLGSSDAATFGQSFMHFAGLTTGSDLHFNAAGGIFNSATQLGNHVFGEAGPEALIPLNRMNEFANGMNGGSSGGTLTATVTGEQLTFILNKTAQSRNRAY